MYSPICKNPLLMLSKGFPLSEGNSAMISYYNGDYKKKRELSQSGKFPI
jgi:hypothetical protein